MSDLGQLVVLLGYIGIDLLVVEPGERWSNTVSLSHLEVLSEVLVSAPPVVPDHTESLVSSHLMEVGIPDIILLPVDGVHPAVMARSMLLVGLSESVTPVLDHSFLLYRSANHESLGTGSFKL